MNYHSLREFVARLEQEGELIRVREKISPILEITEITDRISKSPDGGKALLFENVDGSAIPVLINAFGSYRRMSLALGVSNLDDIARDIERFLKIAPPESLLDKIKLLPLMLEASQFPPSMVGKSQANCQEVVHIGDDVDLDTLPILKCWPNDAGKFITFPMVINRSYDRKIRNVGLYRMQVYDKNTTAMHWHIHKDGAHFFHEYRRQKMKMEVAVAIGGDPASCYSASAPLPYGIDEFLLAGFLRKKSVPLVKCKTVDLEVPASAEIVLEGYIDPSEMRLEGPFGDHTGYYSQDGDYPVFHVTAITHRKNPIYLTTIVGKPPQEDYYLGKATERIFLPLMKLQLPELVDMDMPLEGVFHNCVIVSIDKRFPLQARRLMSALWGMGQMSYVKTIIIVDHHVDVHKPKEILKILINKIDINQDLYFSEGILDVLNHASDHALLGSKLGIDATDKIQGEPGYGRPLQAPIQIPPVITDKIKRTYPEAISCRFVNEDSSKPTILIALDKTRPNQGSDIINSFFSNPDFANVKVLVIMEAHEDLNNDSIIIWKILNNLDPKRDCRILDDRIGIDVTRKLPEEGYQQTWPDEINMSDAIKSTIDQKWNKLFP